MESQEVSAKTSTPNSSSMENLLDLAWADLPPARVKEADLVQMKKSFSQKYPSEHLSLTNSPSARYVAQFVQQQNGGAFL